MEVNWNKIMNIKVGEVRNKTRNEIILIVTMKKLQKKMKLEDL